VAVSATGDGVKSRAQTMTQLVASIAKVSDPSTSIDDLISFSDDPRPEIQRALARNPNTPIDLLQHVWQAHPDCILENPILTLWEFTKTGSAAELIGEGPLLSLYNHLRRHGEDLPAHIFHSKTLPALARQGLLRFDSAVFEYLPFEKDQAIRLRMIEHPANLKLFDVYQSYAADPIWERFATDPHPEIRVQFANMLRSAPLDKVPQRLEIFSKAARLLARDERYEIQIHLANSRYLPADLIEQLSKSSDARIREALTRCVFAPSPVLRNLARDSEEEVRLALAKYSASSDIHAIILHDLSMNVRRRLAENASLSRETMGLFDLRDHPDVLGALFRNPKANGALRLKILRGTSPEVQKVLLRMGKSLTPSFYRNIKPLVCPDILEQLGGAVSLHREIVEDLARDSRPEVRLGVARRITNRHNFAPLPKNVALVNAFACDSDPRIREQVCTDWRLKKSATAVLFGDPDPRVRKKALCAVLDQLVASRDARRFLDYQETYREKASLVVKLARDPDLMIRDVIANCPESPPAALKILFDDPEPLIRISARNHDRWPYGVMLDLVRKQNSNIDPRSLFQGETTPSIRALRLLAASRNPFIRFLVARCKRTPVVELRKLSSDPHPVVRETSVQRFS
jgi:hypothetical protein